MVYHKTVGISTSKLERSADSPAPWRRQPPRRVSVEKVRLANLGKKRTPEQGEKNRQARLGKPMSLEARQKISDALKGKLKKKKDQPFDESTQAL